MAVLANISVVVADLVAIRPDIVTAFTYDTEASGFLDEITRGKETLYRTVKDAERVNQPSLTEAELTTLLENVKDIADVGYLKERLSLLVISEIFKANDMFDSAEIYKQDAESVKLIYWLDEDEDDVIDDDETRSITGVTLGR